MILGCPNCGARFRVGADAVGPAGRRVRCSRCRHQWSATARDLEPEPAAAAAAAPRAQRGLNVLRPKPKPQPEKKAAPPKPKPAPAPKPAAAPPPPPPPPPEPEPEPTPAPALTLGDSADDARAQAEAQAEEMGAPPPLPEAPELARTIRGKPPGAKQRSALGRVAAVIGWLLFVLAIGGLAGAAIESERVMEAFPETKVVFETFGFDVPKPDDIKIRDVKASRVTIEDAPALIFEGTITNTAGGRRTVPPMRGSLRDGNDKEVQAWVFTAPAEKLGAGESIGFRTEVRRPVAQASGLSITFVTTGP